MIIQMKPVQGLFWAKWQRQLKVVPISVEAGILFTHQPMDLLH
jgi:hypothetical protein